MCYDVLRHRIGITYEAEAENITSEDIITEILDEEVKAVEDAKQNPDIVNFLVGKVMQKTRGKADPELKLSLLKKHLGIN